MIAERSAWELVSVEAGAKLGIQEAYFFHLNLGGARACYWKWESVAGWLAIWWKVLVLSHDQFDHRLVRAEMRKWLPAVLFEFGA